VPQGYVVVEAPSPMVVQPPSVVSGTVSVIAERLNVRSGPNLSEKVVSLVYEGDILTVKGASASAQWWYVELPDGKFGWVMARFTTVPSSLLANG